VGLELRGHPDAAEPGSDDRYAHPGFLHPAVSPGAVTGAQPS